MAIIKSIPKGVQALFPMLVCRSPEAEMNFCAAAFGAIEQVRRPVPDGWPIHIAMCINDAFCGSMWTVASRIEETTEEQRSQRWSQNSQ